MANADREINLLLFNPDNALVGEQKYAVLAGYGKKQYIMQLDSVLSPGKGYLLIADIRPKDSSYADTFQTAEYHFDLLNPADITLHIPDALDDTPVDGTVVTIDDSTKTTFQVYPNPASTGIQVSSIEKDTQYSITDIYGRIWLSGHLDGDRKIIISRLTNGIYFLKFNKHPAVRITIHK
jgi:hypothetical protein